MDILPVVATDNFLHTLLAQAIDPAIQDISQQLNALQSQVETLQNTSQLLSESLMEQIEFLRQENQDLTNSFTRYIDAMKWNLTVLAILAAILTGVGGWIFKNNLDDAKKVAREMIDRQVERQISVLVDARVEEITRTFRREQVIGSTYVGYYLPEGQQAPAEVQLLKARQFKNVRFLPSLEAVRRSPSDVMVLDLINYSTPEGQRFSSLPKDNREAIAAPLINELLGLLPKSTVIIVYVSFPPLQAVNNLSSDHYVIPANNPVTLVGNAADGAYVALGDRTLAN